jgi:hypothetical protein
MDWKSLLVGAVLGAFLSALFAIPFTFWVNLKTPGLSRYLQDRQERKAQQEALKTAQQARKRLVELNSELAEYQRYSDNASKLFLSICFYAVSALNQLPMLMFLTVATVALIPYLIVGTFDAAMLLLPTVGLIVTVSLQSSLRQLRNLIERTMLFDEVYRPSLERQIQELEIVANQAGLQEYE